MRFVVQIGAIGLVLLGGCSSVSNMLPDPKVDYRSSTTRPEAKLEVPPDLVSPRGDERFMLPERVSGATLSGYARERAARDQLAGSSVGAQRDVLPDVTGMKIERAGTMRWLTVKRPPGQLWPVLRTFWQESGFTLAVDQPAIGVMETEWAENRAKIPQDFIRSTIGKVFDGIYSTGERDRFRVRLEAVEGGTEIHLSHRGMVEVPGENKNGFVWTQRPAIRNSKPSSCAASWCVSVAIPIVRLLTFHPIQVLWSCGRGHFQTARCRWTNPSIGPGVALGWPLIALGSLLRIVTVHVGFILFATSIRRPNRVPLDRSLTGSSAATPTQRHVVSGLFWSDQLSRDKLRPISGFSIRTVARWWRRPSGRSRPGSPACCSNN